MVATQSPVALILGSGAGWTARKSRRAPQTPPCATASTALRRRGSGGSLAGLSGFGEQAAQDEPAIGWAFREAAHEVGAPVGAEGHVDLQSVSGGVYFLLQIAANSINHLKLVAVFREL